MTGSDWLTNLTALLSNPDVTKEFAPQAGLHAGFASKYVVICSLYFSLLY